ncbi:MAG: nickel/cobalt transporter [Anaerolineales bacterium]
MRSRLRAGLVIVTLIATLFIVPSAAAHPLGNFTINHYVGVTVGTERIDVDYVLDMAEIPAYQELANIDSDGNGEVNPLESANYHSARCASLRSDFSLRLDGRKASLDLVSSALEFPTGAGGLATLRLTCMYQTQSLSLAEGARIELRSDPYPNRLGWREIVVVADGVSLQGDFATTSVSNQLITYPNDLLSNPLNQRLVSIQVAASAGNASTVTDAANVQASAPSTTSRDDSLTRLVRLQDLSLPAMLLAMMLAVGLGAMHAMTPGHGKTVVGAYLIGSRGTARHAVFLGLTTTVAHTAGVFALGLVTLFASQFILPEQMYPWLSFLSGLSLVVVGVNLFAVRLRQAFPALQTCRRSGRQPADRAGYVDHHLSSAGNHQDQHHGHGHDHSHGHEHDHDHDHDHAGPQTQTHHNHSHQPPGADGSPVTWRNLLALGVSGGLLPCPSALIVLLSAISLGRVGFGIALVVAFSLGLAGALSTIGMIFVYARRFFERLPIRGGRALRILPALSAAFVVLIGAGITIKALLQTGLIRL